MKHFLSSKLRFIFSHKKILVPVFLVLIFLIWSFVFNKPHSEEIKFVTAQKGDIKQTVSASGTINGSDTADLKFPIGGRLSYVNVKQGDTVKKNDYLAGLDTTVLSASLQEAKNTLHSNQSALDKVWDDIHLYQYGNGGFSNIGSGNETQTQKTQREQAEAAANSSYDAVKAATRALQDATMTSPIDGIVTEVNKVNGENVSPTDTVIEIINKSQIYFDSEVDESDIGKIKLGQQALVTLISYDNQTFPGTIEKITPTTKTTSSGTTVIVVKINLGNPQINFAAGLNGQADITINESKDTVTLPQETLKNDNNVILKDNSGFKEVNVTKGLQSDTNFEVKSGVSEGQTVVTNPEVVNLNEPPSPLSSFGKIFGKK